MKKAILFLLLFSATVAWSQSKEEQKVAAAVDALNKALVAADSIALDKLTTSKLSYGHSTGKIENKQTFIHNALSDAFKYLSIVATDQTITLSEHTAVVRHTFTGKAMNNGTPIDLKLSVLQVWQERKGVWKLLARQAVKI
jgi:hypothetical protein